MRGRAGLVVLAGLAAAGCAGRDPLVAFLGDSLTSGWRLPESQTYPALLERELRQRGRPIRVLNAGVSGDTVARALARLPALLERRPDVLVVALGINDGLRDLPLEPVESGLREILARTRGARVRPLLVGLRIPRERDEERARRFAEIYPRLAAELRIPLVPFLLEGVADQAALLFPDGLHPTAEGQVRLAQNVLPHLELVLAEVAAARR